MFAEKRASTVENVMYKILLKFLLSIHQTICFDKIQIFKLLCQFLEKLGYKCVLEETNLIYTICAVNDKKISLVAWHQGGRLFPVRCFGVLQISLLLPRSLKNDYYIIFSLITNHYDSTYHVRNYTPIQKIDK